MGLWEELGTKQKEISFENKTIKMGRPPIKESLKADVIKKVFFTKAEIKMLEDLKVKNEDTKSFSLFLKDLILKGVKYDNNLE